MPRGGFCEVGAQWGIRGEVRTNSEEGVAGAVTSADFDGDGRLDLLASFDTDVSPVLWLNTPTGFLDRTGPSGLGSFRRVLSTASADFDGDGRPDLMLSARESMAIRLLRNTTGGFEPAGSLEAPGEFTALVPVDLDGDGMLDVTAASKATPGACTKPFISGCPGGVVAWRQVAPWRFEPVTVEAAPRRVLAIRWHDVDRDGRDELMVIADFGMLNGANQILRVERGADGALRLRESPPPLGFAVRIFGMGVAPIDVDRDGRDELLVTNFGRNVLLRERGGRWEDDAVALGADAYGIARVDDRPRGNDFDPEHSWMGPMEIFQRRDLDRASELLPTTQWTPLVFDYDHDGVDDVYIGASAVGLGDLFPEAPRQSGVLLRGEAGRLRNVTDAVRLGERHGAAHPVAADLDGDGDLDLALPRSAFRGHPGGLEVLRNDASAGAALWIEARGRGGARDGIGARVRVTAGGYTTTRRMDGNHSIAASGPHGVHVGLGSRTHADVVEIRFVSGVTRRLENVPAGRLVVEE
ncbi:MAG: CRTAC1 family protein [Planctomycetota bacterium]